MEFKLLNNSMIASQDDQGNWVYKANTTDRLKPFKQNGNLKAQYKDLPRFKAIAQFEQRELNDFNFVLGNAVRDISVKLLSFSQT